MLRSVDAGNVMGANVMKRESGGSYTYYQERGWTAGICV